MGVTFKGSPVELEGHFPKMGAKAPTFKLVSQKLEDLSLESLGDKIKILNIFISLDTPVCSKSVHSFQERLKGRDDVVCVHISQDLPFAAQRFCQSGNVSGVMTLSSFRSSFPKDYGLLISSGPLRGLLARAVIALDKDNRVLHSEIVSEITNEPGYDQILSAI